MEIRSRLLCIFILRSLNSFNNVSSTFVDLIMWPPPPPDVVWLHGVQLGHELRQLPLELGGHAHKGVGGLDRGRGCSGGGGVA